LCLGTAILKRIGNFSICRTCALGISGGGASLPAIETFRRDDGRYYFRNWNTLAGRLLGRLPQPHGQGVLFSCHSVALFASRQGLRVQQVQTSVPIVGGFANWSRGALIRADLVPRLAAPPGGIAPQLTLGVIAARESWPDAMALCADMVDCAAEIVVVVDTAEAGAEQGLAEALRARLASVDPARLRVIAHPLDADFAAQRNRVQAAATTPWVLHLDCDERLSPGAKRAVFGLIEGAEADGTPVVAFARRNFVDGRLSALYPDLQYRLVRRSIAFTRAVHEYPVVPAGQRAFVHLGSGIVHQLTGAHVARRAERYEAIQTGGGRPHDTALLLQPFERMADLPDQ
jgi:hypothetical protein